MGSATCLKNNGVDEPEYDDSGFEDDEAGPAVPDESDDDVLDESEFDPDGDVLDESESDQDLLDKPDDEGKHRPARTSSGTVLDESGSERGQPLAQTALAAVPDEVGSV